MCTCSTHCPERCEPSCCDTRCACFCHGPVWWAWTRFLATAILQQRQREKVWRFGEGAGAGPQTRVFAEPAARSLEGVTLHPSPALARAYETAKKIFDAITHACPKCGATVGQYCVSIAGLRTVCKARVLA